MYKLEDIKALEKGATRTAYGFEIGREKLALYHYKKGHEGGHHYHKGKIPIKNPEIIVLVSGKLEFTLKDIKTGKEEKVVLESPKIIKIEPNVYHEVEALEESFFLELDEGGYPEDKFALEEDSQVK